MMLRLKDATLEGVSDEKNGTLRGEKRSLSLRFYSGGSSILCGPRRSAVALFAANHLFFSGLAVDGGIFIIGGHCGGLATAPKCCTQWLTSSQHKSLMTGPHLFRNEGGRRSLIGRLRLAFKLFAGTWSAPTAAVLAPPSPRSALITRHLHCRSLFYFSFHFSFFCFVADQTDSTAASHTICKLWPATWWRPSAGGIVSRSSVPIRWTIHPRQPIVALVIKSLTKHQRITRFSILSKKIQFPS